MSCILMLGYIDLVVASMKNYQVYLIDHKLTSEDHLVYIVQKINQKIHALARISKYMPQKKLRITRKAFVTSQFAYCPQFVYCPLI